MHDGHIMIDSNNKALCPAPWVSLYVEPNGRVDNCCVGKNNLGNIQKNTVQEILFGTVNRGVQQNMLDGQYPQGCAWCENKSHNLQSRMFDIFPSRQEKDYDLGSFKLQYLDARWSNTCNLACVYCSPEYSSTWAQEKNLPVRIEKHYKQELLDYVLDNVENLKEVYLAGGEPLLMKENELLIDAIKDRNPECHVLVNTNLTQIQNSSIFKNLQKLKNCSWLISVEDREERFEYIRYPAQWNEFAENINIIKNTFPIHDLAFNMVFTSLNAVTIWDTVDWLVDQGFLTDHFTLALYNNGLTQYPLDVRSMPVEYQQLALSRMNHNKYQNMLGWKNTYDHLAESISHTSHSVLKYLQDLDNRRGLNSRQVFPLVYEHIGTK